MQARSQFRRVVEFESDGLTVMHGENECDEKNQVPIQTSSHLKIIKANRILGPNLLLIVDWA